MKETKINFIGRKEICENTHSFTFNMDNSDYEFNPGQYAHFTIANPLIHEEGGNSRPLSFASSPHHVNSILLAARDNGSVFVQNMLALSPASEVYISEPEGDISLHNDESVENIFIAGGIGVTPVRSIVESAIENDLKNKITLFYLNRSYKKSAFLQDFLYWKEMNEHFRFIPFFEFPEEDDISFYSGYKFEQGRIGDGKLKKHLGSFDNKVYNIIGPPEMVIFVKEILQMENVPEEKIKFEKFS